MSTKIECSNKRRQKKYLNTRSTNDEFGLAHLLVRRSDCDKRPKNLSITTNMSNIHPTPLFHWEPVSDFLDNPAMLQWAYICLSGFRTTSKLHLSNLLNYKFNIQCTNVSDQVTSAQGSFLLRRMKTRSPLHCITIAHPPQVYSYLLQVSKRSILPCALVIQRPK